MHERRLGRAVLGLVAVVTGLRLWVAGSVGLGDAEAYYWTWSRQLDLGFYDHGPVVALLIRLGTSLLGHVPVGVRLLFVVSSGLLLWLVARIARDLAGTWRAGLWSMLGLLAIPSFQVAGLAANPDVPLMVLVACFLLLALRPPCLARVAACGLLVGLAVSTKLMGLALVLPLVHLAWRCAGCRRRALVVGPGLALVGALPVLIWNIQHGGASLAYHLVHRHSDPVGPTWINLAKLVGGQLAYVSPLVLLGLAAAALVVWRERRRWPRSVLLWSAVGLLGGGYALILIVPGAEPHWPAAGYLALLPVLGACIGQWMARRWVRALVVTALAFSTLVAAGIHLHVLTDLGLRLMPSSYEPRYDLSNELRGWDRVARAVARAVEHGEKTLVVGCHYTSCAQLAFAARGRFAVRCPSPRLDQFDFFPGGDGSALQGVDLLYVRDPRFPFDAAQLYRCATVEELDPVSIRRAGRVVRPFRLQRCHGFGGLATDRWPPPPRD